jgi:hypothetical protein
MDCFSIRNMFPSCMIVIAGGAAAIKTIPTQKPSS